MFGNNISVKEPPYTSILKDGVYELREYPKIITVTAHVPGSLKNSQDESFKKLFDYISGNNEARKDIPIAEPAFMEKQSIKIPMTAPVLVEAQPAGWKMSFVLPPDYTLESTPRPLDGTLTISEHKNIKYATLRFSGLFNDDNFEQRALELSAWIKKNKLTPVGSYLRAAYNPPWTLPPLRRNEIMAQVK